VFAGKTVFLQHSIHVFVMKKRDKVLQAAKARLVERFGEKIQDVILFGSRAWGKPNRWSDYDLVVVVRGNNNWKQIEKIRSVLYDLDSELDIITHALVISDQELQHSLRGAQPVFQHALSKGIYA
jgi:predicted nucleotidyltransferase